MHATSRLSCLLYSIVLLVAACDVASEESSTSIQVSESGIAESSLYGPCSASLVCDDGSTISCSSSGSPDTCYTGTNFVSCDGVKKYCSPGTPACAPAPQEIIEFDAPCYPSYHPYGRYGFDVWDSNVTYKWSSASATFPNGSTGAYLAVRPTSVGSFTLTVTATRPGCSIPTVFSQSFYARPADNTCHMALSQPPVSE